MFACASLESVPRDTSRLGRARDVRSETSGGLVAPRSDGHYIWCFLCPQALPVVFLSAVGSFCAVQYCLSGKTLKWASCTHRFPRGNLRQAWVVAGGNMLLSQAVMVCNWGQSKAFPGSCLRPGAMCSCPATCVIGNCACRWRSRVASASYCAGSKGWFSSPSSSMPTE